MMPVSRAPFWYLVTKNWKTAKGEEKEVKGALSLQDRRNLPQNLCVAHICIVEPWSVE